MISIIVDPSLRYPGGTEAYSPDEAFPEYSLGHIAQQPNSVYRGVRNCLAQAGLDRGRYGRADWNPLGQFIRPGQRVFVLCNFVSHRRLNESRGCFLAKCTHASLLRPLIDYVLLATGPCGEVSFGCAPIQSCIWPRVLSHTGADQILEFYQKNHLPVRACDLRSVVSRYDIVGRQTGRQIVPGQSVIDIDLGTDSVLTGLYTSASPKFRVLDYDAQDTERYHSATSHRYIITRTIMETDAVISVPKMKAHEKVGLSCGLKGFVGSIGHKDCLAHHRAGSPASGGDEYPVTSRLRECLSRFSDRVSHLEAEHPYRSALQVVNKLYIRLLRLTGAVQFGAWSGNDTAWRMAVDLARILHYGDVDGQMRSVWQRQHLVLVDGVVGGEGQGPLAPRPVHSGGIILGDNVVEVDEAVCHLMGWDPTRLAIVREAFRVPRFPLVRRPMGSGRLVFNSCEISLAELGKMTRYSYRVPQGWSDLQKAR
jgi:hypothetical protein